MDTVFNIIFQGVKPKRGSIRDPLFAVAPKIAWLPGVVLLRYVPIFYSRTSNIVFLCNCFDTCHTLNCHINQLSHGFIWNYCHMPHNNTRVVFVELLSMKECHRYKYRICRRITTLQHRLGK